LVAKWVVYKGVHDEITGLAESGGAGQGEGRQSLTSAPPSRSHLPTTAAATSVQTLTSLNHLGLMFLTLGKYLAFLPQVSAANDSRGKHTHLGTVQKREFCCHRPPGLAWKENEPAGSPGGPTGQEERSKSQGSFQAGVPWGVLTEGANLEHDYFIFPSSTEVMKLRPTH
jgi:hypothetical protein